MPEIGVPYDLLDGTTEHGGRIEPEEICRRAVDAHDPLAGIDREHPLNHAPQNRLLLRPLATNRQASFHELAAEDLDGAGQSRHLGDIGGGERDRDRPGGQSGGGTGQILEGPGRTAREQPSRQQRHRGPGQSPRHQPPLGSREPGVGRRRVAVDADDRRRSPSAHDRADDRHCAPRAGGVVAPRG